MWEKFIRIFSIKLNIYNPLYCLIIEAKFLLKDALKLCWVKIINKNTNFHKDICLKHFYKVQLIIRIIIYKILLVSQAQFNKIQKFSNKLRNKNNRYRELLKINIFQLRVIFIEFFFLINFCFILYKSKLIFFQTIL